MNGVSNNSGGFATALTLFAALNCAIENDDVIAVGDCVGTILKSTADETDCFPTNCYAKTLVFAINKGNSFVFEHVCSLGVARLSFFTIEHALCILGALRFNRNCDIQNRFLWFLDNCATNAQISLLFAACILGAQYLVDRICDDDTYINLRCLLATVASESRFVDAAVEFDYIEFALEIVQSTPEALPPLSTCNPHTHKGDVWIVLHNKYAAWRAQQEHDALTAEVAGLDKHTVARKM